MKFYSKLKLPGLAVLLCLPFIAPAQNPTFDYGAVPALAQPQGDQAAANQKLDFHTDLFTGRFNDEVPVEVPPGRGGSEPSIALQYNSANGNGWCGVGWDLDMGYIQRETRYGVPIANNAYSDSFGFIYSFAGQSGRLVLAGDGTYRPEVDTAFLKFVQTNGYWVVTDKSGRTYTFGDQPYSTISSPAGVASGAFKWMLSTIQDANGNLTSFGYQTYGDNQLYPDWITYNANAGNSTPTNNCEIIFQTMARSDVPNSCLSGQEIPTAYLLHYIYVYCNGLQVRQYVLAYGTSPGTGRSLLNQVYDYGSDNVTAWPPVTFTYSVMAQSFQPVQHWPIYSPAPGPGSATFTAPSSANTQLIDINGDGLPDLVSSEYNTPYTYYYVQTNTGSGFGPRQTWAVANETGNTGAYWNSVNATFLESGTGGPAAYTKLVDINGDGLPDRVMAPYGNSAHFQVQTNTGNGFGPVQDWTGVNTADDAAESPEWNGPGFSLTENGSASEALLLDIK